MHFIVGYRASDGNVAERQLGTSRSGVSWKARPPNFVRSASPLTDGNPKRLLGAVGVRAILNKLGNKLQENAKAANGQALASGVAGLLGNFRLGHWGRAGSLAPPGRVGLVSLAGQLAGWACALEHWGPPGGLPLPVLWSFRGTSSRAIDAVPRTAVSSLPPLESFAGLPGFLPFPSLVVVRILAEDKNPQRLAGLYHRVFVLGR